jgi:hypothetical protein
MTSPQGLDDLFWGCEYEDVTDWAERLTMAAEVRDLTLNKFFKIAKLNLRGRAKEWFRRLQPAPIDWAELRTLMIQKYGNIDADDIRMKMDAIKQEPRERVQKYFERLDKLFRKGQIQDAEQKRRFLARLRPEIRKLCVVKVFADIEELVGVVTEVERVLGELGETPFEPLKEEQAEEAEETAMEKHITALNNTLINFFKRNALDPEPSSYSTMFEGCQICRAGDHMATTCPRLNEARLKYAKCNMPHRTEGGEIKSTYNAGLGHSEDNCWKKPHFGATNFLEALQDDEGTLQQSNRWCGNEKTFSYVETPGKRRSVQDATGGAVPSPEVANGVTIPQGLSVDKKASSIAVQDPHAYEVLMDNDQKTEDLKAVGGYGAVPSPMEHQGARTTMAVSEAILVGKAEKGVQNTDDVFGSTVDDRDGQVKERLGNVEGFEVESWTEENLGILVKEKSPELGIFMNALASPKDKEMVNVDDTREAGNASLKVEELFTSVLPPSTVEDDLVNQKMMVSGTDEQQTFVTQPASKMVDVLVEVSKQEDSSSKTECGMEVGGDNSRREAVRMQLPDSFVTPDDSSIVPIQKWWKLTIMVMFQIALILESSEINNISHWSCEWKSTSFGQANVAVSQNDQPFSDMEVVMLNKSIIQNEFEVTATTLGFTSKYKESPTNMFVFPNFPHLNPVQLDQESSIALNSLYKSSATDFSNASACEASAKQRVKACCTDQLMNPRMGQIDDSNPEESHWIYFIQDATRRMWERLGRDDQIHHVKPD